MNLRAFRNHGRSRPIISSRQGDYNSPSTVDRRDNVVNHHILEDSYIPLSGENSSQFQLLFSMRMLSDMKIFHLLKNQTYACQ